MKIVVFGLSLSSSWGNGHATTYRALLRAFAQRGHEITFFEWNAPWYSGSHRDLAAPLFARLVIYPDWPAVRLEAMAEATEADAVIVGSYVRSGAVVIDDLLTCAVPVFFYDIETPVTAAGLRWGACEYLRADQVPHFTRYLSFTGGPFLERVIVGEFGARAASPLYCSVDTDKYRRTETVDPEFAVDLAYMGTFAPDRQQVVEELLLDVARRAPDRRFIIAGPQYPDTQAWPGNVRWISHLPPGQHATFYSSARWQLNATRADMVAAGWSPSVRLFEAGATGASILSDYWAGIDELFEPGREIFLPEGTEAVLTILDDTSEEERRALGEALRSRVFAEHSSVRRAEELERYLQRHPSTVGRFSLPTAPPT
jgi:spore maturation protein CgeB